jgi:hypothetical protein
MLTLFAEARELIQQRRKAIKTTLRRIVMLQASEQRIITGLWISRQLLARASLALEKMMST